jgi:hypothetical protein
VTPNRHSGPNDLMRTASGERRPLNRAERASARAAADVVNEVRLAAIEADGAMALADHIMYGLMDLDSQRKDLQGSDPLLALMLGEIEATAVRQVKKIQNNLYTQW